MIRRDGKWSPIFKRLHPGGKITEAKQVDGFLYLLHKSRWQLVIADPFNIKSKPAEEFLINQAHVNTVHAELDKIYVQLSNEYHWHNTYTDTTEFVASHDLCELTTSSTQKPVGLLTPLNTPTQPWIEIAMDSLFLKQLIVDYTKLIPGLKLSDKQKP